MRPIPFVRFCDLCREGQPPLSPAQRALVAVSFDGVQPGDLEGDEREAVRHLFGDVDHVPPDARSSVAWVLGRAASKSYLSGLYLLWRALTADLSSLATGQRAYGLVVSPRLSLAREIIRYARGAASDLRIDLSEDSVDGFVVMRDDGHEVAIEAIAASARGTATRGRSFVGAILDEAAFFFEAGDGYSVNADEVFRSVAPRILPGGAAVIASSPWTESGLLFDLFSANHGHPSTAIAAHGPTLLLRPDEETRAMVERETKRDPENAAREFGAFFLGGGAGLFFDPNALALATVDDLLPLPVRPGALYTAAIDPAFRSDAAACVILETFGESTRVAALEELRPTREAPLKPSVVVAHFAEIAKRYRCPEVWSDAFYVESIREHLATAGLELQTGPEGQPGKIDMYATTRTALAEGRLSLPDHGPLLGQLRAVVARPAPGGALVPTSPRRRNGGGHGDLASALVLAAWAASKIDEPSPRAIIVRERGRWR